MRNVFKSTFVGALAAAMLATTTATADPTIFVPVATLAGQSKEEVAQNYGEPDRCEEVRRGTECIYENGSVEIVFIGGEADRFRVYTEDELFTPAVLERAGLPTDAEPSFANEHVMRWEGLSGLRQVELHPWAIGTTSPWILVKARTP